jgi:cytochrome b
MPMKASSPSLEAIPVWDRFIRLFHWTLVSCVVIDYTVLDDGDDLHQWLGYLAAALVVIRVVWGFIGTPHARFSDFFPTPTRIRQHVKGMLSGSTERHDGHNPLGALMILALMIQVLAVCLTGWMQSLDAFWGEEWLQELHEHAANLLIALASLHALAAIVMGRLERTHLIRAMFTGVKERW